MVFIIKLKNPASDNQIVAKKQKTTNFSNFYAIKLDHNAEILHDVHGAFGFDSAWIAGWYGKLRIKVGEKFTILAPTFRASAPLSHVQDDRKPMATVGMGWEYAF